MIEIAASLLGAYDKIVNENYAGSFSLSKFLKEMNKAIDAGVDRLEVDSMRRKFVPETRDLPLVPIYNVVKEKVLIDIHYMGHVHEQTIDNFLGVGGDPNKLRKFNTFAFHYEATPDPRRVAMYIKENGMKASIALNPWTPVSTLEDALEDNLIDEVLIMSVCPGKGKQKFIENTYKKVSALKMSIKIRKSNIKIKVDGGVNEENAQNLYKAGADVLVIGSAFFNSGDYKGFVDRIRKSCN